MVRSDPLTGEFRSDGKLHLDLDGHFPARARLSGAARIHLCDEYH
jgi:hypothetical protein